MAEGDVKRQKKCTTDLRRGGEIVCLRGIQQDGGGPRILTRFDS